MHFVYFTASQLNPNPNIYIIPPQVHERGMDSDFGLGLLCAALGRQSSKFKLILMSATISTDKFAEYLGKAVAGLFSTAAMKQECLGGISRAKAISTTKPVAVLFIPGFTFDVTEYYKNHFEEHLRNSPKLAKQAGSAYDQKEPCDGEFENNRDYTDHSSKRIGGEPRKGDLDYDLLVRIVIKLAIGPSNKEQSAATEELESGVSYGEMFAQATGSVLVFLPGVPEINKFVQLLRGAWSDIGGYTDQDSHGGGKDNGKKVLRIMPLHGGLSAIDQKRVFTDAASHELKIVAATNVAEASVTIPDVTVVVDSCRVKETDFEPERQMNALVLKFASKDSLRQRRGRAGRVAEGRCFRCITQHTYGNLPNHSVSLLCEPFTRIFSTPP